MRSTQIWTGVDRHKWRLASRVAWICFCFFPSFCWDNTCLNVSLRFIAQLEISFFPRCRSPGSNKSVDSCSFFFSFSSHSWHFPEPERPLCPPPPLPPTPPSHYPWFWGKSLYPNIQQLLVLFRAKKKKFRSCTNHFQFCVLFLPPLREKRLGFPGNVRAGRV